MSCPLSQGGPKRSPLTPSLTGRGPITPSPDGQGWLRRWDKKNRVWLSHHNLVEIRSKAVAGSRGPGTGQPRAHHLQLSVHLGVALSTVIASELVCLTRPPIHAWLLWYREHWAGGRRPPRPFMFLPVALLLLSALS